ncbi:RNA polymerase sigma factor [Rhizosphaericola mali]|nr:sigma-70 family RNA polymerase sigma factor [Rhizosphaericola mali]
MLSKTQNEYWIRQLKSGDRQIFTQIFHDYSELIYKNICQLVTQSGDAEDILQEVFVLLWNKRMSLSENTKIDGWLFNTSYFKSLEYVKKEVKNRLISLDVLIVGDDIISNDVDLESEIIYEEKLQMLREGIDQLSEQRKNAFVLCKIEGKSYVEAAAIIGVSATTVKDYVKVATKLVKKYALINDITLSILVCDMVFKK